MSPERPPESDGGPILEPSGIVISTIHGETSRVILQSSGTTTVTTARSQIMHSAVVESSAQSGTIPASSKVIVLQPSQLHDSNYISSTGGINGESNGVGNIVLVATEPIEMSGIDGTHHIVTNPITNGTNCSDEDLTSLTWLYDKNPLKGINLSCTSTQSKQKDERSTSSPIPRKSLTNGVDKNGVSDSPASDYVDDSCVSEDNTSSANSSSDQGIGVNSTDTSPTNFAHINYNNGTSTVTVNNNNNNTINKNRNQIITQHSNGVITLNTTPVTINGLATKTVADVQKELRLSQAAALLPKSVSPSAVITATNGSQVTLSNGITAVSSKTTEKNNTSTSVTTPHQHFHKKYLREVMKEDQLNQENGNGVEEKRNGIVMVERELPVTPVKNETLPTRHIDLSNTEAMNSLIYNTPSPRGSGHKSCTSSTSSVSSSPKQKHHNNLPYDPMIHTNHKPPFSFSSLIFMAIEDSIEKALPVKEIYSWIVHHYPYFKTAPTGWKNSVRHNLSLNKCFSKVEKAPNMGKGSLWRVEELYRDQLMAALTRSPSYPCSTLKSTGGFKTNIRSPESPNGMIKTIGRQLNPDIQPRLYKYMTDKNGEVNTPNSSPLHGNGDSDDYGSHIIYSSNGPINGVDSFYVKNEHSLSNGNGVNNNYIRDLGVDTIDDVNAATAMLALKHGPKIFIENYQSGPPIITSSPSEDHTYSAGNAGNKNRNSNGTVNGSPTVIVNSNNNHTKPDDINFSNSTSSEGNYDSGEDSNLHPVRTNHNRNRMEMDDEQRRHAEGVDAFLKFATEVSLMASPIKRAPSPDYNSYEYPLILDKSSMMSSPPKKSRTRTFRTKIKKKTTWMR